MSSKKQQAETRKARKRIRYAGGEDEQGRQTVGIQYHGGALTMPGARVPWRESDNNPLSTSFIPLTDRGEMGKSRWWALFGRRNRRPTHGVFDA